MALHLVLSQLLILEATDLIYSVNMPHTPLRSPDPESLPSMLANLLKFPPRAGQIDAIRTLAVDQLDLILIAPTG
jgi:hypothetical protein